jgi:hypothetical protein
MIAILYSIASISSDSMASSPANPLLGEGERAKNLWHIKPSKFCSYEPTNSFKLSTNIVPEEGIPQTYLDEGSGNVHGDQDGAPAPPRRNLNQSTEHSEKSPLC